MVFLKLAQNKSVEVRFKYSYYTVNARCADSQSTSYFHHTISISTEMFLCSYCINSSIYRWIFNIFSQSCKIFK